MRVERSPATRSLGRNLLVVRAIFMLILSIVLIASFFTSIAASAAENVFKITNTSLIEASQNVEEDFEATDEANISDALLFHRVGDYAKFKITLNNSDSINHTIESITDDNDNEYIALEYADYAGTAVNSGDSFDFLLTIKYTATVDDINNRDQNSSFKLYIKYAESEKPDEIDPSSPDTSDNFKVAVTILVISATGLLICLVKAKRIGHKVIKTITVIALVVSSFVISNNTQAASEGTDVIVFTGEYHLYDQLVITLDNGGAESTTIVNYNATVGSITKPEAPNGYEFDTWKDKDGNPISDSTKLTEDTKLFAGYKIITYTILYEGLESDEEQGLPTEYNIETGATITPRNTRKDDDGDDSQTFAGWKDENNVVSQTVTIPTGQTGNRTFIATWEDAPLTTYTATCNLNGGQGTDSYTFNKKTETFAIQNPTKDFYDFKGWSGTDLDGEENTNVQVAKGTRKNLQFEAHYTPTDYTISYTGLDESELAGRPTSYNYESTIHLENPADRFDSDGDKTQSFNGWSSTDITITDNKDVTFQNEHGNKAFKANWTTVAPTEYTITYNYNNGEDPGNETEFTKYESINVINPTRDYYNFAGWTGEGINITDPMHVTIPVGTRNNVTLNATWTPVEYDITYTNLTETESAGYTKKYTVETGSISLTNPADRGNDDEHFDKWTSSDVDVSDPTNISLEGLHKDITITANWAANSHSIAYVLNEGTNDDNNPANYTKNDLPLTINQPTREYYTFVGWTSEALSITEPQKNITIPSGTKADITLTANWTPVEYNIIYTNLTSEETANFTKKYTVESGPISLTNPADHDNDDEHFVEWTSSDVDVSNPSSIVVADKHKDITITANWEANTHSLSIDLDGGTTEPNNPTSFTKNTETFTLIEPTKNGYKFKGWSGTGLDGDSNKNVQVVKGTKEDLSFVAHFSAIHYTVEFNINTQETIGEGDDVEINNLTCTYDSDCIIPNKTLILAGYTFNGWNTQADGNGTPYAKGADLTNITTTDGDTITLYAQWSPNLDTEYNIEFYFENIDDNEFTKDDSKTITKQGQTGATTEAIDTSTQEYQFTSFTFDSNNSNNVISGTIERHGNTTLKLYYTRNTYEITFNANGGKISGTDSETTTITAKYGKTIAPSEFPELTAKQYADFAGWYTTADDSGEAITADITISGTQTIYAHWTIPTLCKKATELHVETCINSSGGCSKNQYSVDGGSIVGKKNTSTIVYGKISDGNSFEIGDAFDCDVNGDGEYNASNERFYYIRDNSNKAVLVYSSNFEGDHVGITEFYNYGPALTKLPTTEYWGGLERIGVTYHDNKVARLLNAEDTVALFGGTGRSISIPLENDFVFENTGYYYYDAPASEEVVKPAMWTEIEKSSGVHYRIHTNQLEFNDKADNSSKNVVRPVIEVPMTLMDQSPAETVTITFNAMGGEAVPQLVMGKGNAFRSRATTTRTFYTFKGWCFDEECTSEVSYSTIIDSDVTLYANWELTDAAASVGDEYYSTLAEAIEAVPTTGIETEVVLLKNITENTINIENGRNVLLNGGSYTLTAGKGNAIRLNTGSKLTLASGTITSKQKDGVINVNEGTELVVTGGKVRAEGIRGAIFNNGGTVSINGGEISATSGERATIHNLCRSDLTPKCYTPGTINIYGGSIESTGAYAIFNEKGTLNIGNKNGTADTSSPIIRAKTYGIIGHGTTSDGVNFYDGTIAGKTDPTAIYNGGQTYNPSPNQDPNQAIITDIESGYNKQVTTDSDGYKNLTLTPVSP